MRTGWHWSSRAAAQVLGELARHVTSAMREQGGNFWTGCYTGGDAAKFCAALRIEIEEVDALEVLTPSGERVRVLSWYFQPTLLLDTRRNVFVLQIPKSRLKAHPEYKKFSYVLRALADFHLTDVVPDAEVRKELAWEFCDNIRWRYNADKDRMRTNDEVSNQLSSIKSPAQLHADDIPLSQVAAFMARSRPDLFSFSVFYMKNMQDYLLPDEATDCEILQYRELGAEPPRLEVMLDCHCSGQVDIMSRAAVHAMIRSPDGCQHLLVSDTPFRLSEYLSRDGAHPGIQLLEVNRTVLFSIGSNASWGGGS